MYVTLGVLLLSPQNLNLHFKIFNAAYIMLRMIEEDVGTACLYLWIVGKEAGNTTLNTFM